MKSREVSIRIPRLQNVCPPGSPSLRLALVVLSIGAASHFMLYLDSVVDNLLPAALPFFKSMYETSDAAESAWEIMVSARIYGLAVGCFISILICQRCGRKLPILIGIGLDVVGVILTLLITSVSSGVSLATLGRMMNGVGQGIVQTVGSVMLVEIPPMKRRGTVLATLTVWACLGELGGLLMSLNHTLGNEKNWHLAMGVPLIFLLPALLIIIKAPESPRYLYIQNKDFEARKALLYYQLPADARVSIDEMESETGPMIDENGNKKPTSMWKLSERINNGKFVRPLLIAMVVQSFVHLDDWLWISYSTPIFEKHGISTTQAQYASLLMSFPQAIISFSLLGCFDKFDRRTLLIVPTCISIVLGILAIMTASSGFYGISGGTILVIIASMDLSVAAVSGESAYAIVPELFLPDDKIAGTAIVGIVQNVFGGVITNILLTAVNKNGLSMVLIPFVVVNCSYVLITSSKLPETKDKSAQEVSVNFSSELPGISVLEKLRSLAKSWIINTMTRDAIINFLVFIIQCLIFAFFIDFCVNVYQLFRV